MRAAEGVDAAYAMSTPFEGGVDHETTQGKAMTDAAIAAGVSHFVFSSVGSADQATGIPHFDSKFEVEKHIRDSGVPFTIIAPVFFMENLLLPWGLPDLRQGKLAMELPAGRPLQQVAVADIGAFVAAVIDRGEEVTGRRFDIAGDELTGEDAAAILAEATGREFRYEGFPPDVFRPKIEDMALMYEWFDRTGYSADIEGLHRDFPDVNWHTYEQWAQKQDWSVLEQSETQPLP